MTIVGGEFVTKAQEGWITKDILGMFRHKSKIRQTLVLRISDTRWHLSMVVVTKAPDAMQLSAQSGRLTSNHLIHCVKSQS